MWIWLNVFEFPIFISFEFLYNAVSRGEGFQILDRVGEMNLGRNNRIQPSFDNLPDTCFKKSVS